MKKALFIITGILTIILGVYAMCVPFRTFLSLGWVLGALLLVGGIELIVAAKKDVWQIILGVLISIAGCVVLFNVVQRFLTDILMACIVGIAVMAYGISLIVSGIKGFKASKSKGILSIICGILSIILGGLSVAHPFITMISIGFIIAFCLVIQGINLIVTGATLNVAPSDSEDKA